MHGGLELTGYYRVLLLVAAIIMLLGCDSANDNDDDRRAQLIANYTVEDTAYIDDRLIKLKASILEALLDERIEYGVSPPVVNNKLQINLSALKDSPRLKKIIDERFPMLVIDGAETQGGLKHVFMLSAEGKQAFQIQLMHEIQLAIKRRAKVLGYAAIHFQRVASLRLRVQVDGFLKQNKASQQAFLAALAKPTATVSFHAVYVPKADGYVAGVNGYQYRQAITREAQRAMASGYVPPGTLLLEENNGAPVLIQTETIVGGADIVNAEAYMTNPFELGGYAVLGHAQIAFQLDEVSAVKMLEWTKQNKGKAMVTLYRAGGENNVISVAMIMEPFGERFQVQGIENLYVAEDLAFDLNLGSLPAPVDLVEFDWVPTEK